MFRAPVPPGVREHPPVARDDARVAVDQLRFAERAEQHLELVGPPGVVLVGQRHVAGVGGDELERALEVPIEAEPLRRTREDEARVARDRTLDRRQRLRPRAVVADHAHPAVVRLGADRVQLTREQLGRRIVGGHRDRDPPVGGAIGPGDREGRDVRARRKRGEGGVDVLP